MDCSGWGYGVYIVNMGSKMNHIKEFIQLFLAWVFIFFLITIISAQIGGCALGGSKQIVVSSTTHNYNASQVTGSHSRIYIKDGESSLEVRLN